MGGKFYINELLPTKQQFQQEYDVMVTPPNHFAIGRLAEELTTSHRYEAGDAIDDWIIKVNGSTQQQPCDWFGLLT